MQLHLKIKYKGHLPDVSLLDENTSVVDGLSHTELEDLSLQSSLKEIRDVQSQDVIQLVLRLVQNTSAVQSAQESRTLENTSGILLVQSQQLTSSCSDLFQNVFNSPDFALVLQAELSDQLEFGVDSLLLEWTTRSRETLGVYRRLIIRCFIKQGVERKKKKGNKNN